MMRSYEVGYKSPPRNKQFKNGVSGNPRGRPKGRKTASLSTTIERIFQKKITITENGQHKKITLFETFCRRIVTDAANGKAYAVKLLCKYLVTKEQEDDPIKKAEKAVQERYYDLMESMLGKPKGSQNSKK